MLPHHGVLIKQQGTGERKGHSAQGKACMLCTLPSVLCPNQPPLVAGCLRPPGSPLQRYVAVFLGGRGVRLVVEDLQGADDLPAGIPGVDDVIDVAAGGGDVGGGELLLLVRNEGPGG